MYELNKFYDSSTQILIDYYMRQLEQRGKYFEDKLEKVLEYKTTGERKTQNQKVEEIRTEYLNDPIRKQLVQALLEIEKYALPKFTILGNEHPKS